MSKDKLTDKDARVFWETCAAAAMSGAVATLGRNAGDEEMEGQLIGTACALADKMLNEWAEKFDYDGPLANDTSEDAEDAEED
jgi:hypothetical protein